MKKITLFFVFILMTPVLKANSFFFCPIYYGQKYKSEIRRLRNDKVMHCTMSCYLSLKCKTFETYSVGWLKEFIDLIGPGDADLDDIEANNQGITLVKTGQATNKSDCKTLCNEAF